MVNRPPLLEALDGLSLDSCSMPDCTFRIGEGGVVSIDQFPNLRAMALYVIGKAPMPLPDGRIDTLGVGPYALGSLIGDAHLKLMYPWPEPPDQCETQADAGEIEIIIDCMLPISPRAAAVRAAFLFRVGEFIDLALHHPTAIRFVLMRLALLTNKRLTERARTIMETGIDPGADDLWSSDGTFSMVEHGRKPA